MTQDEREQAIVIAMLRSVLQTAELLRAFSGQERGLKYQQSLSAIASLLEGLCIDHAADFAPWRLSSIPSEDIFSEQQLL